MIERLHYITHPGVYSVAGQTEKVLSAGVKWIQFRAKEFSAEQKRNAISEIIPLVKKYRAKLIINDDVLLAKEMNADGVHIGQEDLSPAEARKLLGSDKIIGVTANSFEDILKIRQEQIDYIGLGPFRFTATKEKLSPILGISGYTEIIGKMSREKIQIPVIAIGGIQKEDLADLFATGIHGVAVSSALLKAEVEHTTNDFLQSLNKAIMIKI